MKRNSPPEPVHVWLVMMKAKEAIDKYAAQSIQDTGLCESDFRVLEVLLHKGPLPVNVIGPKVDLNAGSISVAVDRLHSKGLVTRRESAEDRRVRMVALTPSGRKLIVPIFRKHAAAMNEVFSELTVDELQALEAALKRVGQRAAGLAQPDAPAR
jgi:MarR family 2-MHQ and catechol resistance regulon transcriptional repressor